MSFKPLQPMACVLLVALVSGCSYGELSPAAYQYAKALYGLSDRQVADRVDVVAKQILTAAEAGEISTTELTWLHEILDDCRQGNWDRARDSARQMMEDQVRH